ncbi:MAG: biopolymer transporter ExbD [Planctomycetota bacterium]|nr:biopolymer transporter ExbD [Planctomycetota bacterium]
MRIKKSKSEILEGDLTPMIDMTFQLIAFFMVLINFTQSETNDMVQLPDSALAKPPDAQLENLVIIHLAEDGTAIMNRTEVNFRGLLPYLNEEYRSIEFSGDQPKQTTIVIRAHRSARGGMVQELIQVCQEAGFENFALRAEENVNSAPKYIVPLGG